MGKKENPMILLDMNQLTISHLMVRKKIENEINIDTIRKSVLSMLGRVRRKYQEEYGEMVLCYDDREYWRRSIFPQYKKNRKKEREASTIDWDQVFSVLNSIGSEIKSNFPFRVMKVQGAEADDVISTLCFDNLTKEVREPILILSADKDFIQLHRYDFVKQYDSIRNKWITCEDPETYLKEHIIKGDRSDGIPNILTNDDAIVNNMPQKRMSQEKISELANVSDQQFSGYIKNRNWKRNSDLIDFRKIPSVIRQRILATYYLYPLKSTINIPYFIQHNIQDIMEAFS
jgi:hypothetical protein